MKRIAILTISLLVCARPAVQGLAQIAVPPPAPQYQPLSATELDQLLGPIALYPDPLIAQILPAATLPSQVVLADRYVSGGGDPNLIDQQPWDASIQALARYPQVLKWMDDNLAWTTEAGQAFLAQQQDVMDSIQRLRAQAQALGNLQTSPQENIFTDNGAIEIVPADPQVVYVPVYQPDMVYYQRPLSGPWVSFGIGLSIGAWLNHDVDWHDHHVIEWDRAHPRPTDWWSRRPADRPHAEVINAPVWQPRDHHEITTVNRGDRGWNGTEPRSVAPSKPQGFLPQPRGAAITPVRKPEPSVVRRPPAISPARPATGALIGVQSPHQTQQFSNRGQQSRQAISRPAQTARPAAPARQAPPARSAPPSRSPGGPAKR
jgi:hypothetical protein